MNKNSSMQDFPGGPVVKNLPANVGDTVSIPDPARFHVPRDNWAHVLQLLSPHSRARAHGALTPCSATWEAQDGWMASPTHGTWVWVNSRSWRWSGRPGVLQSMGLQRMDTTERLNWTPQVESRPHSPQLEVPSMQQQTKRNKRIVPSRNLKGSIS